MKKNYSLLLSISLATTLLISTSPLYAKESKKPSPPTRSAENSQGNSNSPKGSIEPQTAPAAKKDEAGRPSDSVLPSNQKPANPGTVKKEESTQLLDKPNSKQVQPPLQAKISTNRKLNPSSTAAAQGNSRADKARLKTTRLPEVCRVGTAKGRTQVETDPCSDFIVVFQPGLAKAEAANLLKTANGQVKREFSSIFQGVLVNGPLSKMQALANNPNILVVEDDLDVTTTAIQSAAPWGLDRVDQNNLPLTRTFDDADVTGLNSYSYVVDTGIEGAHQDFEGRVVPGFTTVLDGRGSADCNGHGTHVAGILGGKTYGVAKRTILVPVRVLDCTGSGTYSTVIAGLDWIAANHRAGDAAVVNLSLGGPASSTLDGAVKNLIAKGISVVVAAGNSNADACNYSPSRVPDALTVGATADNDARASYSNIGTCLDIFVPGSAITSAWLGSTAINTISGTSMAAPHVAGLVARFLSVNSGLTPQQVANSIKKNATLGVLTGIGTGSPNSLAFISTTPDLTSAPVDSTPTFQKVNPRGKVVGKK